MCRHTLRLFFICAAVTKTVFAQTIYEGFGSVTKGGTGKKVIHVTNLNAKGPGSLHAAMGSNRIIVFDVGGTIEDFRWDSSDGSDMAVSNLTIDGSTAPPPGITLNNNNNGNALSFQDGCHDIIVKNIRVRNAGNDGFSVVNAHNIIFDHVSSSGNVDGGLDITAGSYNITVQWSIFGKVTSSSSGPMLIAYTPTRNISIHHNLFNSRGASTEGSRNPLVHSSNGAPAGLMADIRNNIIWNWGNSKTDPCCGYGHGTSIDHNATANVINNFYQTDGGQEKNAIDFNHEKGKARGFVSGNVFGNSGINPNRLNNRSSAWPAATVTTQYACTAAALVLADAGPRPLDKDDQAVVDEVSLAGCAVNQMPVAEAGTDVVLKYPVNSLTITGKGSDKDGRVTRYAWTKISGPKKYTIKNTSIPEASIINLQKGTYVFQLTVTDNRGDTATDSVSVTVK